MAKVIFEEIMADKFLEFIKDNNLQIQEIYWIQAEWINVIRLEKKLKFQTKGKKSHRKVLELTCSKALVLSRSTLHFDVMHVVILKVTTNTIENSVSLKSSRGGKENAKNWPKKRQERRKRKHKRGSIK